MSSAKKITVEKTTVNGYTVRVDDKYADQLTVDEAIGVVASALFSDNPIFVKTHEENEAWKKRFEEKVQ